MKGNMEFDIPINLNCRFNFVKQCNKCKSKHAITFISLTFKKQTWNFIVIRIIFIDIQIHNIYGNIKWKYINIYIYIYSIKMRVKLMAKYYQCRCKRNVYKTCIINELNKLCKCILTLYRILYNR